MDRGIYVAASGGLYSQDRMASMSNNIANINVPGFKKDREVFIFQEGKPQLQGVSPEMNIPAQVFVKTSIVFTDFTQGALKATKEPHDMAIKGDGFFVVNTKDGTRYTRKGDFKVDGTGRLITQDGNAVQGQDGDITLIGRDFLVGANGDILEDGQVVDRIRVVTFEKPYPFIKLGAGYYESTNDNAKEIESEDAEVHQFNLEVSNASAIQEMVAMISGMRSYEANVKLIQNFDKMTEMSISVAK